MNDWPYRVRIYAPANKGGHLLIETTHKTEWSRDMEVAAARARSERGEVGSIEVSGDGVWKSAEGEGQ